MMTLLCRIVVVTFLLGPIGGAISSGLPSGERPEPQHTRADAERMIAAAEGKLAPVYAPLAEEIVETLRLSEKTGVGIDLGSGPGTLIIELCKRTEMHWINADINAHFFHYFLDRAEATGCSGRVSAIRADACALPLRDSFADVVVSRGSFPFWPDAKQGLAEVVRILKPQGIAYIGRGFPRRLPLDVAKQIRKGQGKGLKYDPNETEKELRDIMKTLGIRDYHIRRPRRNNADGVNYGLWLQFRKPAS